MLIFHSVFEEIIIMTLHKVWLDDLRDPFLHIADQNVAAEMIWFKDYDSAFVFITENAASIAELHLDNDLGDPAGREGKHLFNYVETLIHEGLMPELHFIQIHSSNSSSVNNIMSAKDIFRDKYGITLIRQGRPPINQE